MQARKIMEEETVRQRLSSLYRSVVSWSGVAVLAALAAFLFSGGQLNAQVENGVAGTITDASGAVMPGVTVTVVNNATGVSNHSTTSSVGVFRVIGLEPGKYSVAVEASGFKRSVQTDVTVEVAKTSTIDFQ